MRFPILGFLIPRQEIAEWLKRQHIRQLRTDPDMMALTKAGLDECHRRLVSGQDTASTVNDEEVAASRESIVTAPITGPMKAKFYERSFAIKSNVNRPAF